MLPTPSIGVPGKTSVEPNAIGAVVVVQLWASAPELKVRTNRKSKGARQVHRRRRPRQLADARCRKFHIVLNKFQKKLSFCRRQPTKSNKRRKFRIAALAAQSTKAVATRQPGSTLARAHLPAPAQLLPPRRLSACYIPYYRLHPRLGMEIKIRRAIARAYVNRDVIAGVEAGQIGATVIADDKFVC